MMASRERGGGIIPRILAWEKATRTLVCIITVSTHVQAGVVELAERARGRRAGYTRQRPPVSTAAHAGQERNMRGVSPFYLHVPSLHVHTMITCTD